MLCARCRGWHIRFAIVPAVVGRIPGVLIAGDLTGDGISDLLLTFGQLTGPGLGFIAGSRERAWGDVRNIGSFVSEAAVAADFNGDGRLDIANGRMMYLGRGDGTFRTPFDYIAASGNGPVPIVNGEPIAAGDF